MLVMGGERHKELADDLMLLRWEARMVMLLVDQFEHQTPSTKSAAFARRAAAHCNAMIDRLDRVLTQTNARKFRKR